MLIQAGQSGRGQKFAADWGEMIFVVYPNLEVGKKNYASLKEQCAATGRDPDTMKISHLINPFIGETRAEAEDKFALTETLPIEADSLMLLSEALNFDFGSKPLDEPFTREELDSMTGLHAMRDRVIEVRGPAPTIRDFIEVTERGTGAGSGDRQLHGRLPTTWKNGSRRRLVTASLSRRRVCQGRTRISYAWLFRNCSVAASITRITPARHCARTLGSSVPKSAPGKHRFPKGRALWRDC